MPHKITSSNISQKLAFLHFLQRMDVEMLDMILDNSIDCFGVPKQVFLEKLAHIFTQVKLAGGTGILKIKQHKNRPDTNYLLLKPFGYATKFVITEDQGIIKSIHNPRSKTGKEDIENLSSLEIFFGEDEKKDFQPSSEYVMNLYKCTGAYAELINDNIQMLSSHDIWEWIEKYELLYHEIKDEYLMFKYNEFRTLFSNLENLAKELSNYEEAKLAINSFSNVSRAALKNWLEEYYDLAFCQVLSFSMGFSDMDREGKVYKSNFYPSIYFRGDDFTTIIRFNELYQNYFDIYRYSK